MIVRAARDGAWVRRRRAGEGHSGWVRACGERSCAAAQENTSDFFCRDTKAECGRAEAASGGTEACILSLPFSKWLRKKVMSIFIEFV
jgi:hypothetical protein